MSNMLFDDLFGEDSTELKNEEKNNEDVESTPVSTPKNETVTEDHPVESPSVSPQPLIDVVDAVQDEETTVVDDFFIDEDGVILDSASQPDTVVDSSSDNIGYDFAKDVIRQDGAQWLFDTYEPYAKMVISDRAFADSDGQKPVNRRILWSMFQSKATSQDKHVKAAKVVGNTMGSYHPHGDASISDALARMAQGFVNRVPLVDAQGSVGKVAGDKAAAPRYWECRLSPAGMELLNEVPYGAAEMIDSYDGENTIPEVLPARWPSLIVNGSEGIGVGYASKCPPHNPSEAIDAVIEYIRNPEMTIEELRRIMPGPDFPDGSIIEGVDGIESYYTTGIGKFFIRARYEIDYSSSPQRIIFTEIPYGNSAEKIKATVQELINPSPKRGQKVAPKPNEILARGIASFEDRTDKKTKSIVLECEVNVGQNPKEIVRELFERTPLKTSFNVNANVLLNKRIFQASMFDLLKFFIDSRRVATRRKMSVRLEKIAEKNHQLEGILLALVDLDKVIAIIRGSESQAEAKQSLIDQMSLSEIQAEYILAMQLRRLTKADSTAIEHEQEELSKEMENIKAILKDSKLLDEDIIQELLKTKKIVGDERRSEVLELTIKDVESKKKEDLALSRKISKNADCFITRFSNGTLIRTYEEFSYEDEKYKKSIPFSPIVEQIKMKTQEPLIVITSDGLGHRVPASFIPEETSLGIEGMGLDDLSPDATLVGIAKDKTATKDIGAALATSTGGVKIVKAGDFPNKSPFPVISMDEGESLVGCRWLGQSKNLTFAMVSSDGNIALFDGDSVRPAGHKAGSVKGMKLKSDSSKVIYFNALVIDPEDFNVVITQSDKTLKQTGLEEISVKGRGGMGVATQGFRKGESKLIGAYIGASPLISLKSGAHSRMMVPPIKSRASTGEPFDAHVDMGESTSNIL